MDADLRRADLSHADLFGTVFRNADLSEANLLDVYAFSANLEGARLRSSSLFAANLTEANLSGADLTNANLCEATLHRTDFSDAQLQGVELGHSILIDQNLALLCRTQVKHNWPSVVDFRSILRTCREPDLPRFLRDTGMPEVFVQYSIDCARSLSPDMVFSLLQSTFISYGGPDAEFARRLNQALRQEGVTTFFFEEDAIPGDELQSMMRRGVNEHDRVILICSESSLTRPGLLNELKETLRREARDGGRSYLIPIVLDDYLFDGWNPEDPNLDAKAVTNRVAADFRGRGKFKTGVAKLIAALKKP